jgi:hypothetical protein
MKLVKSEVVTRYTVTFEDNTYVRLKEPDEDWATWLEFTHDGFFIPLEPEFEEELEEYFINIIN